MTSIEREPTSLGYALLGVIHQAPQSGYGLRKAFTATPLAHFSDSPGAIYPALHRLEKSGWLEPVPGQPASGRRRLSYRLTRQGKDAFLAWLRRLPVRDEVLRDMPGLMLRFAFMSQALRTRETVRFLDALCLGVEEHLRELEEFLASHGDEMTPTGRLAFECGLEGYRTYARWAGGAAVGLAGGAPRGRR